MIRKETPVNEKVVLVGLIGVIVYVSYKAYKYCPRDIHIYARKRNIKDLEEYIKKYPNDVNAKTLVSIY